MNSKLTFYSNLRDECRLGIAGLLALALLLITFPVFAQSFHEKAQQQALSGDIAGMADSYLSILEKNPEDIRARLGYATANSWLGNHELAQQHYNEVLQLQPKNIEALSGLGYDYAWSGQYAKAEARFTEAMSLAPDNVGIQKGLAFTYLWGKQPDKALKILERAEIDYPNDAEIQVARGQALKALGEDELAIYAFKTALSIDPDREDARNGLKSLGQNPDELKSPAQTPAIFDISAWYGSTSDGGESGLREVFLGYTLKNSSRIWFRYDDSLSLDNPALARSGEDAETYYIGFQAQRLGDWQNIVELGYRELPADADQQIIKFEATTFQAARFYKFGLQISPHSNDYTDKLIYTGLGYPLNKSWRLEPVLYLSSSGAIDDRELRAVVFAEYVAPELWSIGLGAGIGRISSDVSAAEGSVSTANLLFSYPVNQKTRLSLSLRYEDSPTNSFSTALVGISAQLP